MSEDNEFYDSSKIWKTDDKGNYILEEGKVYGATKSLFRCCNIISNFDNPNILFVASYWSLSDIIQTLGRVRNTTVNYTCLYPLNITERKNSPVGEEVIAKLKEEEVIVEVEEELLKIGIHTARYEDMDKTIPEGFKCKDEVVVSGIMRRKRRDYRHIRFINERFIKYSPKSKEDIIEHCLEQFAIYCLQRLGRGILKNYEVFSDSLSISTGHKGYHMEPMFIKVSELLNSNDTLKGKIFNLLKRIQNIPPEAPGNWELIENRYFWELIESESNGCLKNSLILVYFYHARKVKEQIKKEYQDIKLFRYGSNKEFGLNRLPSIYLSRKIQDLFDENTTVEDIYAREKEHKIIERYYHLKLGEKRE